MPNDGIANGNEAVSGAFTLKNSLLPEISNIRAAEKSGDVQIEFALGTKVPGEKCKIDIYRSTDSGETYIKTDSVSGDSAEVTAGHRKLVIWKSGLDFMDRRSVSVKIVPAGLKGNGRPGLWGPVTIDNSLTPVEKNAQEDPELIFSAREMHASVTFDDKIWVIGGWAGSPNYKSDAWRSADGVAWDCTIKEKTFISRHSHASVVFDNKIWMLGGFNTTSKNDVWYTADGTSWVELVSKTTESVKFTPRDSHAAVAFNDGSGEKLYVIGGFGSGYKNDIWCSTNGYGWAEFNKNAEFSPRLLHRAAVFKNRIWVIGGFDGTSLKNDVWSSRNGIIWECATPNAGFSPRKCHALVAWNGNLWVIGGDDGNLKNDIWRSPDGKNWVCVTPNAAFTERRGHSAVVFNGKILIIGGYDGINYKNDVWRSK